MIITTIQEANLQDCGCCAYPVCADPQKECESKDGVADYIGYASFTEPAGDLDDSLPLIYHGESINNTYYDGTIKVRGALDAGSFLPPSELDSYESMTTVLYVDEISPFGTSETYGSTKWQKPPGGGAQVCTSTADLNTPVTYYVENAGYITFTYVNTTDSCTETEVIQSANYTATNGTEPFLLGCPGPWATTETHYWDLDRADKIGFRLIEPKSEPELIADAIAEIPAGWTSPGNGCVAFVTSTWPSIGETTPEGGWPICDDYDPTDDPRPPSAEGEVTARKSRYRFAPPDAWFTEWDAWHDGGEIGPEPAVRSVWEMEWDEVFFPKEWDEWDQGGRIGAEPTPTPSLVAERSWVWDGNPANRWSDWYVMDAPETEGEKRVVNVMVICWKSTRTGVKPTVSGEVYEFPPP